MNAISFLFYAPKSDWIHFICFFIGIFLFVFLLEWIRKRTGWSQEVNRKLIHIMVGCCVVFTPYYFISYKPLIWFAFLYTAIDFIAVQTGKLKSMHGVGRISYGTVFFPLSTLILLILFWKNHPLVFMISMLIMSLPDAFAAIVGENLRNAHRYKLASDEKSIEGSIIMFLSSFICTIITLLLFGEQYSLNIPISTVIWIGGITAAIATPLEALSSKGSDNLTVPLGSAFIIHFMLSHSYQDNIQLTVGLILALTISVFSFRIHFLNASGSVSTFILATIIFGAGGWAWTIPILTFFLLSSILSKSGKQRKKQFDSVFEKSSRRDIGQVLANGGLPGALVLLYTFYPHPVWYFGFLGALAAVNADTWATEIGVLSKMQPRLITTGKPVPHGISGGITSIGLFGALIGSSMIALSGLILKPDGIISIRHHHLFLWIILSGFLAALLDSVMGATVQGQFQCKTCKQVTEKKYHCQNETRLISGYSWINNDMVNFFCSISGVLFFIFLWIVGHYSE